MCKFTIFFFIVCSYSVDHQSEKGFSIITYCLLYPALSSTSVTSLTLFFLLNLIHEILTKSVKRNGLCPSWYVIRYVSAFSAIFIKQLRLLQFTPTIFTPFPGAMLRSAMLGHYVFAVSLTHQTPGLLYMCTPLQ